MEESRELKETCGVETRLRGNLSLGNSASGCEHSVQSGIVPVLPPRYSPASVLACSRACR